MLGLGALLRGVGGSGWHSGRVHEWLRGAAPRARARARAAHAAHAARHAHAVACNNNTFFRKKKYMALTHSNKLQKQKRKSDKLVQP